MLRTTALHSTHVRYGAKLVEFGGWEMPISYGSGTIEEHLACRNACVAFDVSHLGTVRVEGPQAFDTLQNVLSNDLRKIEPGRTQYTHLLDPKDGSVLDDIIVWWVGDDIFDVMPNASNTERVLQYVPGIDTTSTRCVIAVQGPTSRLIVSHVSVPASEVKRNHVAVVDVLGTSCVVAGTGYTGEAGIEIAVPTQQSEALWDALAKAGAKPAGLGARDTLRLEAGLPLHGHELGAGITPLQANLEWVVGWKKDSFQGMQALVHEKSEGVKQILRGISTEGRRPPREGSEVFANGVHVGHVTSGNFSPVLQHGIALAFLKPAIEVGTKVEVDVRGTKLQGSVVSLPFVTH